MDINYLKEQLYYEPDTGEFYWIVPKQGRVLEKPAGSLSVKGYRTITVDGTKYLLQRLAWFYMTGVFPEKHIGFKDNNPLNTRWSNLILMSINERTHNYRKSLEERQPTPPRVPLKPIKRATFSSRAVHEAVEEFIKTKTLTDGVYV